MTVSSTSGLTANNDFAGELLLNRIMDGQLRTTSGRTVTAGSRSLASRLDSAAGAYGASASALAAGKTVAVGAQDALTEIVNQLKIYADGIAGMTSGSDEAKALGTTVKNNINAILGTAVNDGSGTNYNVFGATGGASYDLGAGSGSVTVGNIDLTGTGKPLENLIGSTLAGGTATAADANTAIAALYNEIAAVGSTYNLIANRYDMLNDLASSYRDASTDQALTTGGNATSLLNSLL